MMSVSVGEGCSCGGCSAASCRPCEKKTSPGAGAGSRRGADPSVDQINKIVEDMAILRVEVGSLVADTQRQQLAIESNGKVIESNGKAIESIRKAIESNGKSIKSHASAIESHANAIESQGKTLKMMQAEIAVHDKLINALLPWVTRDKLVSKCGMLEKYREMLFAAVRVNENESVVDLIQRVRTSNPDKVVLWALDQHSSISADINEPLDIEEARAVVRVDFILVRIRN
ncbi:hypothetical protein PF008_g10839 [Phytophthora fragariae]|uniref:Uncharacterized protein n=1 Tax=Phytophthora fragariae TaxID=53985 RepID=A0A6G0RSG7_9STRA|nr:hypothetical protein PF008_g10839 [Phytophthora fragariae]